MCEKPKTLAEAKKLIAGSAGVEFEKYPLKFAVPTGIEPGSEPPPLVFTYTPQRGFH
jgi:hypothetical protein